MTAPDPITTAREALEYLVKEASYSAANNPDHARCSEMHIDAALDYATDLLIELNGDAIRIQDLTEENEKLQSALSVTQEEGRTEIARLEAEVEKLKAERDEARRTAETLINPPTADEKVAEFIDPLVSATKDDAGLLMRVHVLGVMLTKYGTKHAEITRLTSQLDLYKAALERIVNLDDTVSDVCDHLQDIALEALKDRQAKGEG